MAGLVVDTHALLWYLEGSPRLSTRARKRITEAMASGDAVHVPSVCLVEATYLTEKGRIGARSVEGIRQQLDRPDSAMVLAPLDRAVADALARVPREEVPDMPDRIIVATALHLGVPLVTCDREIRASNVESVW